MNEEVITPQLAKRVEELYEREYPGFWQHHDPLDLQYYMQCLEDARVEDKPETPTE